MKTKILLLTGIFFLYISGFSQQNDLIVNGFVSEANAGGIFPVPDQAVEIMIDSTDTGYFYQNTVFTDDQGFYSDTIPVPPEVTFGLIHLSTFDSCLGYNQEAVVVFVNGSPPVTYEFLLCDNTVPDCEALFVYFPLDSNMVNPLSFQFQDVSIGSPTGWAWEFGDGNTSALQDPMHIYADTGYYEVCLTITDSSGNCTDTYCETIFVGNINPPTGCESYFYYDQDDTLTFTFYAEAYMNGMTTTNTTLFEWDFGDGTTGTGQFISHTYDSTGVYTVILTTTDSTGCAWTSAQQVWVGNPQWDIFGTVYLDSNLVADMGIVRLMTADSLFQTVIQLDSTGIQADGSYIFEDIPLTPFMLYFVQAELKDGSIYFGSYLPTYHISSLTWQEAFPVLPIFSWPADIFMIEGNSVNSGDGTIGGNVTSLGTRGQMEGVHIMIMDEDLNPYTYVTTDSDGYFEFDNLAYGTYVIHAEMMGINTTQAVITLSEDQPESQVNFIVEGNQATLSIREDHGIITSSGNVYPNPVTDRTWLEIDAEEPADLDVMIFNQMGQKVYHEKLNIGEGNQRILLNTSSLSLGIHHLNIISENGDNISKKLVKTQ
jgi:hypothetical protein